MFDFARRVDLKRLGKRPLEMLARAGAFDPVSYTHLDVYKRQVRDVGRVLQMPYGQVDRLSKLIPVEGVKPVSIEKALADEPRLREAARAEEVVKRLLDYGQQIEGLLRNASTHACLLYTSRCV